MIQFNVKTKESVRNVQ